MSAANPTKVEELERRLARVELILAEMEPDFVLRTNAAPEAFTALVELQRARAATLRVGRALDRARTP